MREFINNNIPKAPCKECHEKGENYLGCHSKCESYKEYKRLAEEANQRVLEKKNFERTFYAQKRNVCAKIMKAKKKK